MYQFDTGNDVLALRKQLGMTQIDFASALGVSVSALKKYESQPILDRFVSLAVECIARQRATNAPLSPEERAERRFREKKRLAELVEQSGLKAKRETLQERALSSALMLEQRQRFRAILKRNRQREAQRQWIASTYPGLVDIAGKGDMPAYHAAIAVARAGIPRGKPLAYYEHFLNAMGERVLAPDDPLVTLPPEPLQ